MRRIVCSTAAVFGAAVLACGFAPSRLYSQDAEPGWINVRVIQVKPDQQGEWEELQKEMSAAMKKAGSERHIWQVVRGEIDTYHIVTMVDEMGNNDEPSPNPLGDVRFAAWASRVAQCVGDRRVLVLRRYPDLSIPAKEGTTPGLMLLGVRRTTLGSRGDFADLLRDQYVPALKKAKVEGYYVSRVFAGDSPDTWITASYIDKWAEFDTSHPITEALGQEKGSELFSKTSALLSHRENILLQYREDLSALP